MDRGRMAVRLAAAAALFCASLAGLCLAMPCPARADGLHCAIFGGESVLESWKAFLLRIAKQVRPNDPPPDVARETLGRRADPFWLNPAARTQATQAVFEIILIFEYVDPYNFAPDSPPWMARQETREEALADARAILREIGRPAAFPLWDALAFEIRLQDDPALAPYREFRKKQRELQGIRTRLEVAGDADDKTRAMKEEVRRLREKSEKTWGPFNDVVRQINAYQREIGKKETDAKRKAFLQSEIRRIETEKEKIRKEIQADADRIGEEIEELNTRIQQRQQELMAAGGAKLGEDLRRMAELQAELARSAVRVSPQVRRGDLFAMDPMMCPRAEFVEVLRECLTDLGVDALPALDFALKSARAAEAEEAKKLRDRLKQARFSPALVALLAEDEKPARGSAREFLREIGLPAFPALIGGLSSDRQAVRAESLALLRAISGADAGETPDAWNKWLAASQGGPQKKPDDGDAKAPRRPRDVEDVDEPEDPKEPPQKKPGAKAPDDVQRLPPGAIDTPPEKMPELEIVKPEKK